MNEASSYQSVQSEKWSERWGINRNNRLGVILMALLSAVVPAIVVLTDGNMFATAGFICAAIVLCVTVYRVQWGFFLFIGFVLAFDQFDIPESHPLTATISYLHNIKEIPYLPSIDAAV